MAHKRKRARPVTERDVFTDELGPAKARGFQSQDAFFRGVARDLERVRSGRSAHAVTTVSFESVPALLMTLTPKRYALIEAVKEHGRFESIEALANVVGRDRAAVSRDLKALAEAGLLRVREAVLPGHGRRLEIAPAARRLKLELTI